MLAGVCGLVAAAGLPAAYLPAQGHAHRSGCGPQRRMSAEWSQAIALTQIESLGRCPLAISGQITVLAIQIDRVFGKLPYASLLGQMTKELFADPSEVTEQIVANIAIAFRRAPSRRKV